MNANVIQSVLARTRAAADQRAAANRERYRDLVRDAATGRELDPDALVEFLDLSGHDVHQFQADVEALAKRYELKALADQVPGLRKKYATAEAALLKATEERTKAIAAIDAKYNQAAEPLGEQLRELDAAIAKGNAASSELYHSNKDPEVIARRDAALARRRAAEEHLARLHGVVNPDPATDAVAKLERSVTAILEDRQGHLLEPALSEWKRAQAAEVEEKRTRIASFKADRAAAAEQLPAARDALAAAQAELDRAEREMANP